MAKTANSQTKKPSKEEIKAQKDAFKASVSKLKEAMNELKDYVFDIETSHPSDSIGFSKGHLVLFKQTNPNTFSEVAKVSIKKMI